MSADCWNTIGIAGDRSCPELPAHVHCRNCPVFASAAQSFFDRPAPEGYLDEWTLLLAEEPPAEAADASLSVLIFRLGAEWLALATACIVEVTLPRPVRRIPHRSNEILQGLVNLRGRLHLCVSLHGLLGIAASSKPAPRPRMVVLRHAEHSWVFAAEEVAGVHRIARASLRAVPTTHANPEHSFSQAVFVRKGVSVGFLDDPRVCAGLEGLGR